MTLNIFPTSPIWAGITRAPLWGETTIMYDSGHRQASTAWVRPLYTYQVVGRFFSEIKQSSLHAFWNTVKGQVKPFLFSDPYDYKVNGVTQPTSTNMGVGSGFYFVDANSYRVIPNSSAISVDATDSAGLANGVDFVLSQDNGWCELLKAVGSVWVSSFEFFRKVKFGSQYGEQSDVWNIFNTQITLVEIPPQS